MLHSNQKHSKTKYISHITYSSNTLIISILPNMIIYGPRHEKNCLRGFANNKSADQPAHPRRLISAFVIRILESMIY